MVKGLTKYKHKVRIQNQRMKEFQERTLGLGTQLVLISYKRHWHAKDHRQLSNTKWLWIELRGQCEERSARLLDQSRLNVAGRVLLLFSELNRRLSRLGPIHCPRAPHIITFLSFIIHHGSLQTDSLKFNKSTMLRVPPDAPEREREKESESLHSPVKRLEDR